MEDGHKFINYAIGSPFLQHKLWLALLNVDGWMIFFCSIHISYPPPYASKKKEGNIIDARSGHIRKKKKTLTDFQDNWKFYNENISIYRATIKCLQIFEISC